MTILRPQEQIAPSRIKAEKMHGASGARRRVRPGSGRLWLLAALLIAAAGLIAFQLLVALITLD